VTLQADILELFEVMEAESSERNGAGAKQSGAVAASS
jgi:hypothetical protein